MAWFAAAIPYVSTALGVAGTMSAGKSDAANRELQAQASSDQGRADEEAQRREGRQVIGKQAAAMAEAGGGVDEGLLRQSTVLAELDALNIRYGAKLESLGLLRSGASMKKQSNLLAGAQLLAGASKAYTYNRTIK